MREQNPVLPGANESIDFDQPPFFGVGLGPVGQRVEYYDFDVQPAKSIPVYVLMHDGERVDGQGNIVDHIPGDQEYSDYWLMHLVDVSEDYVANSITSLEGLLDAGFAIQPTLQVVNCPIVPEGSSASRRLTGSPDLDQGWYRDQVAFYFTFNEQPLALASEGGSVAFADIFVTFNINPGEPDGGPTSGFMREADTGIAHNVLSALPGEVGYSPLWFVSVYDNAEFDSVIDLPSALAATLLPGGGLLVNCPVVQIGS